MGGGRYVNSVGVLMLQSPSKAAIAEGALVRTFNADEKRAQ